MQEEAELRKQLLAQNEKLLQSIRVELKVYEKLDEEHRKLRGTGCSDLRPFSAELHSQQTVGSALFAEMLSSHPHLASRGVGIF